MSDFVTVTEAGVTVASNSESAEQLTELLKPEGEKPDLSKAASELGKKGGEAAAKARAAKVEEKDDKPEAGELGEATDDAKAPPAESSEDSPDSEAKPSDTGKDKPLGKPRDDPRARMLEATRQAAEAKRERDAIRAEKERLAAQLEEARRGRQPETPATPQRDPNAKPKAEEFESYEDYLDARDNWNRQQWDMEAARTHKEIEFHKGVGQAVQTFIGSMDEAEKADPEFHDKAAPVAIQLRPSFKREKGEPLEPIHVITDEIISSGKQAPALTLYLAEHDDEFQRIKALPTILDVQMAIAELRGIVRAQPSKEAATAGDSSKPEVSRAPKPVRPVAGSPHTADQEPDENASYEAHKAYWNRRDREKSARR